MRTSSHLIATFASATVLLGSLVLITACSKENSSNTTPPSTNSQPPAAKTMHPSWDADQDGMNDCENDGSCDDTIDYTQPRPTPTATQATAQDEKLGPFVFVCDDEARSTFTATFFTANSTLVLEHNQSSAELQQAPAASGSKYEGNNTLFWEHHGEARIQWGDMPELVCKPAP